MEARIKKLLIVFTSILSLGLGGCASHYLDTATPEISSTDFRAPSSPQPAQLLFEFQTKGVFNSRATDYLREQVLQQVKSSGLFSVVSTEASDTSQTLAITLNNVPVDDNAFSKGFATGFTFGLVGSQVTDGYVCSASLTTVDKVELVTNARHALHTTLGSKGAPENAIKAKNIDEAITLMTTQIISQVLNGISQQDGFHQQ